MTQLAHIQELALSWSVMVDKEKAMKHNKKVMMGLSALAIATTAYATVQVLDYQTAIDMENERMVADFDVTNAVTNQGIKDSKTNLIWSACFVGQTYSNGACLGTPTEITSFTDAQAKATGDWRLPTIKELSSITDHKTMNPAVNKDVFPFANTAFNFSYEDNVSVNTPHYINPAIWSSTASPKRYDTETGGDRNFVLSINNGEIMRAVKTDGVTDPSNNWQNIPNNRVTAKYVLLVKDAQ